jgi:hypothetical protein
MTADDGPRSIASSMIELEAILVGRDVGCILLEGYRA